MSVSISSHAPKAQIEHALKTWKGGLAPADLELFEQFVVHVLPRIRGPFLAQHRPSQVLEHLERAFHFARKRTPGTIKAELAPSDKGIVVRSCMQDQPFIVDTLRLFLRNNDADYLSGFNLVFRATRDAEGQLVSVGEGTTESVVMLEAERGEVDLEKDPHHVLVRLQTAEATVTDFRSMTRRVERFVEKLEDRADSRPEAAPELRETAAFLKWLLRDNFVFMGLSAEEPFGVQRLSGKYCTQPDGSWPARHESGFVQVRKSAMESPIHRAGRIDEILVKVDDGEHSDELYICGLFTYRAVTQPSRHVPILRRVLANILAEGQNTPGSYRYKGMANVFDSLPTEFLFTAQSSVIAEMVDLVFEAEQSSDVGVTFFSTGKDGAFCLVAMPKTEYSEDLRRELENVIRESTASTYCDHGLFVGRYDTVLLHYYLTGARALSETEQKALTTRIRQVATPWQSRLWSALAEAHEEVHASRLADTYGRAFPDAYVRDTSAAQAVTDIRNLQRLSSKLAVIAELFESGDEIRLRLYQAKDVYLTRILPVLDNFGLVVRKSWATEVTSRGGKLFLDTFVIDPTSVITRDRLFERKELLESAIEAVFAGQIEDDPLNMLVLTSGMTWEQVDLMRGYTEYSRQLNVHLSGNRLVEILQKNPDMCGSLVGYFQARFDPDLEGDRQVAMEKADDHVDEELRYILSHDEDLVFTTLRELMKGTIRTNYYRRDRPFHYLSFKLDCAQVPIMGPGRPMFEIYVHHREVEGVHLRFGKVARGGLRWSDRDDYRTEVLGLVTTQLVKNVVIVPTGSKGGFYLKHPSQDPKERRREADHHYKTFIRGLLDLTDNNVDGVAVTPDRVVRHDDLDPYLVVAADKGTAHLSDTANRISRSYGYWLDDAFASGGSVGYDHKGVGITARGAWVLVRRHFAEMGRNPYEEPFTVVGVGDMGGDVFGNGLIESDKARLQAAFNHLHIFLDPDPDPASSYAERKRLFEVVGGWDQYDTSLLSEGGGIFDRRAKSIPLSPACQQMLGIFQDQADPNQVINAILKMDVDLLWNGGIGTYVKASTETHAKADDRSNDLVRVDATELRAKIIGEGGNLGLTQNARIEANLRGVRLNTDAIDNSGGVDLSDHEVNLKILLSRPVERGELSGPDRNDLLEALTDEVAGLVLANNDAHGRQLSRDQIRSRDNIFSYGRAIAFVEDEFPVTREQLRLPTDAEVQRRAKLGLGLSRPELAVLSAWVKMYVYRELLANEPKEIPGYEKLLFEYFPAAVRETYADDITNHMLADEIAMTVATTSIIADAGAAFFPMALETTGASVQSIATSYLKAQKIARADEVRSTLEELRTSVGLESLYTSWVRFDAGAQHVAGYWLSAHGRLPTDEEIVVMGEATQKVYELQASEVARRNADLLAELRGHDIPMEVAMPILQSQYINIALMIWAESRRTGVEFSRMVVHHLAVARASRLQSVLDDVASRPAGGRWDPIALSILHNRFHQLLRQLVAETPMADGTSVDVLEPQLQAGYLKDVRQQVDALLDGEEASVATLLVLEERIASAISRLH